MSAYIIRRLLLMVPTLFAIMLINFLIIQIAPGGESCLVDSAFILGLHLSIQLFDRGSCDLDAWLLQISRPTKIGRFPGAGFIFGFTLLPGFQIRLMITF